ncbi:MAG: hypothetical protein CVT49_02775 [candidate division Zixibacteria bacterium HGW-Zixibacteria-1]|nr:MAG: hypothetical protein CVT49_02775 [candidate division Zixibacteria bacterium HGW-Zixibacteria-1]
MKIAVVDKNSPLFRYVRPGYNLLKVNGEEVKDNLDFMFKSAEESLLLEIEDTGGLIHRFELECPPDPGLTFENDKICRCKNKCIFCFVHQQPKGMRRSLYVKDDDFRLSFTHGNFVSFSNIDDNDIRRIVEQRLSPLYVSVHATEDELRRHLFNNKNLPPIMPQLRHLAEHGIMFHTQVVVCPGINDGAHLDKTISDLFSLYPSVQTLGVVPVGLTRYREKLPQLTPFDKIKADDMIDSIHSKQKEFLKREGTRFVFAADEFYILAGHALPRLADYETMEQFENGIGMMRLFITDFNRRKRNIKNLTRKKKVAVMTGVSAYSAFNNSIITPLKKEGFIIDLFPVENHFWGKSVTVSGLLTGKDILAQVKRTAGKYDIALLPPNCLNNDMLFLDNISLEQFRKEAGIRIEVGDYSMIDTLKEVLA